MATVNGTSFADNLVGTSGADTMNGRAGDDVIRGGGGRDTITLGSGRDTAVYTAVTDSSFASNWDLITDFVQGEDRIDLTALLGATDLTWGGLTATANGVWYSRSGTTVSIFVDTNNAPGTPEMRIDLQNMSTTAVLTASDFTGVAVRTNTAPVISSQASWTVPENGTAIGTVVATDADSPTVTYSLVNGLDSARFAINPNTGVLSFVIAPNFEVPVDVGGNNVYSFTVQASDGSLNTTQAVTVTVTNVNEAAPVITSPATFTMPENSTAVGAVVATDADNQAVTYSLVAGGDAAAFTINPTTGALSFAAAPNFEAPADVGANNVYNFTVQASDGALNTTQAVAVTVTNVNDVAPSLTSLPTFSIPENSTAVGTVTATDADSPTVTYSLVTGGDSASFAINPTTGALSFVSAPDFEAPADAGADNVYNITVQASDGTLNTTQAVAVTVTNVVDETLTGNAAANTLVGAAGNDIITGNAGADTLTGNGGNDTFVYASAQDSPANTNWQTPPDGTVTRVWDAITDFTQGADKIDLSALLGATDLGWAGTTPTGNAVWYVNSGTTTFIYADIDNNPPPDVMIALQNRGGLTLTANDFIGVVGGFTGGAGAAPVFTSLPTFSVPENGTAVGNVVATDADSPTVTYSLVAGIDSALFTINPTTGALSFAAAPNFEAPADVGANNVYNVTVQASDGTLNTTQAVAVTVTDVVNETPTGAAPVFTSPAAYTVAENSTAVGAVTATDADSPTVTYSLVTGGDSASFAINPTTGALSFVSAPDFEAPADAGADNVYNITVQASDGTLNTTQAVAVTVTNVVDETLTGNAAANTLVGAAGNDIITGNAGADTLTGNGGNDTFVYASAQDSPANTNWQTPPDGTVTRVWDAITDFTQGADKIDLSAFLGATDLGWAGTTPTGNAVWYVNSGTTTFIYADIDNNPPPDVMIALQNRGGLTLTANDFIGVVGGFTGGAGAAPVFTSLPTFSIPENGTAVGNVVATDADSPTVTYSLVAGIDSALFTINPTTGALSFAAAPNFEAPADVGANNVYNFTVQASDGGLNTTQAVTVTVTNVVIESIAGTAGNDTLTGTAGDDLIDISAGGNDTVAAGSGNDTILAGAAFTAADRIDGGTEIADTNETDTLVLDGNYAAGVVFTATTLINVEEIHLTAGNSYSLTTSDATVVAASLSIDGSALLPANTMTVNASAETEAGSSYTLTGGAGNDMLTGGAGPDYIDISFGGNDIVNGNAGRDTFYAGGALTAADQINGGAGTDIVYLNGDYSAGLTLGATTLTGIEGIVVQAGNNYSLTMNNAMLTGTQTAAVDGFALGTGNTLSVNASAETDSGTVYTLSGGAGNDSLTGGAGNDILNGNAGNDTMTGGLGNDVFDFNVIADRGTTGDTITDFSRSGANGVDVLNLHDLLLTFTGYNGTNAFTGGYLQFDTSSGTSTTVRVDTTGGANSYVTLATLTGTLLQQTDTANYVL